MTKCRGGRSLALEASQHVRVVGKFLGDNLQGHNTTLSSVLRFEDDTHGPASDLFENAVLQHHLADHCFCGGLPRFPSFYGGLAALPNLL
jgi:hypothetical protein